MKDEQLLPSREASHLGFLLVQFSVGFRSISWSAEISTGLILLYSYIKKPEEGCWDEGHGARLQSYSKREGVWKMERVCL